MDVQRKVATLIRRYKTDDPFRLAAYKNIRIMYADLGGKFGNYLKYKRSKFIIIDDRRTPDPCCRLSVRTSLAMRFAPPMTIPSGLRPTP